jgi:hypothetical protein
MLTEWGSLNLLELAMSTTLIKSRLKAYNLQQGRCIYCELPMWLDSSEEFAKKYKVSTRSTALFKCTAEHLLARQDGGKDVESNIVAACHYCNQMRHKRKSPKDPNAYKQFVINRICKGKWNSCMLHRQDVLRPTELKTNYEIRLGFGSGKSNHS